MGQPLATWEEAAVFYSGKRVRIVPKVAAPVEMTVAAVLGTLRPGGLYRLVATEDNFKVAICPIRKLKFCDTSGNPEEPW